MLKKIVQFENELLTLVEVEGEHNNYAQSKDGD